MNRHLHRLILASAATAAIIPGAATAAVPSTAITSPDDGYAPVFDALDGKGPNALRVSGAVGAGASASDRVDVVCLRRGEILTGTSGSPMLAAEDVPLNAPAAGATTRTFSVAVDAALPAVRTPCRLRAIPANATTFDPAKFTGPAIFPSGLRDFREQALVNANVGTLFDVDANTVTPARTSTAHLESFGGCGLWDARPLDPSVPPDAPALNVFDCAGWADDVADLTVPTRSELQVDGRNAFTGAIAALSSSGLADVPGRPPLTRTATRDAVTGLLTLTEATDVVRCDTQPAAYPFTAAAECGTFVPTGLRFTREATMSRDGRVTTMHDAWTSTDGGDHVLDLLLEVDLSTQRYGIQVPWAGPGVNAYSGAASFGGPPSVPASLFVRSDRSVPDGDLAHPTGAVTFSTAPTSLEFVSGDEDPSRYLELHYLRPVPAGGALSLTHTFSMAPTAAESAGLAAAAEDSYAGPSVSITAPSTGATTTTPWVLATGRASDNRAVASLTVAGVAATLAADGTWAQFVTLVPGPNTITAHAADGAGNAGEATTTITYAPPAGVPCVVPKVAGLKALAAARATLVRAGCTLGRVRSTYVRPVTVRKGKKRVRVVVKRFTIIGTRPKTGTRLAPRAAVDVLRQGRKPVLTAKQKAAAKKKALAERPGPRRHRSSISTDIVR